MPFTPSHAVVALPFLRTPLAPAAVAVGAMAPDLPLFVRATPIGYEWTHSFAWIPATMLLALALLLIWRCALRPAARELSPRWLASRLPEEWDAAAGHGARETFARRGAAEPSWVGTALLAAALAIGVASHIAWDLFTHEGRWGLQALPLLTQSWGPLPGYKWLQHGSSVFGLVILAVWAVLWLARRDAASVTRVAPAWMRWMWWLSLPAILVAAWIAGRVRYGPLTAEFTYAHLAYLVLPPACALWGVVTLALCILMQVRRARTRSAGAL